MKMKLSEKIFNKKDFKPVKVMFGSSPGYASDDVEDFLDEVVVEVENLEKEISNLQLQIRNLMEESKIEDQVLSVEGQEEIGELKEKLKRTIEQFEVLTRGQKQLLVKAEEVAFDMKKEAKETAQTILDEAKTQASALMKKAEERYAEKEREISRLESEEKRVREQFGEFAKMIETAVKKA